MTDGKQDRPKAVLVAVQLAGVDDVSHRADVQELERLVTTLGLDVVGVVEQKRSRLRAGTVLGLGKLEELALWTGGSGDAAPNIQRKSKIHSRREKEAEKQARDDEREEEDRAEAERADDDHDPGYIPSDDDEDASDEDAADDRGDPTISVAPTVQADVVVVDHELSPRMARNLERATNAEVLDRSQVIVEIFHRHAKSREARLQVEIARLTYVAPRLREAGAGADRQRGGIGGKGAGESAVELDRRRIRDRISELKRELEQIHEEQVTRRAARKDQRRVALVGYTNAGKSSLMRALTGSEVYVADKLFATLDTTVRALKPETTPRVLVSDTVGFIKKLPHELVASFRSTLDEALEASLLLFVVDASDPTFREQLQVTQSVLGDIGATDVTAQIVLNKRDRIPEGEANRLALEFPGSIIISAKNKADVARAREMIIEHFDGAIVEREVFVPYAKHGFVKKLHDQTTVLGERHEAEGTFVKVRGPGKTLDRLVGEVGGDG